MSSERTGPERESWREEDGTSWEGDGISCEENGAAAFFCREGPIVVADGEQLLLAALYRLPLRAGFTDEVLTRIRDQTPIP